MIHEEKICCDFCEVGGVDPKDMTAVNGWQAGVRGKVYPAGSYSGTTPERVMHACPKELCQAKLLVWART
jgi:hypothetical protein